MKKNISYKIIISICILVHSVSRAQEKSRDTTLIYQDIKAFSKKEKITSFIHGLLFRNPNSKQPKQKKSVFKEFEGKTIHKITIETTNPFGYSIDHENKIPDNFWEKIANAAHIKSKKFTIQNYCLFKSGKTFDSLEVMETYRILHSQNFIYKVAIIPELTTNLDSVNIHIRVIDSWSKIPSGSASSNEMRVKLSEVNFLGLGHEFINEYYTRFNEQGYGYSGTYIVKNIRNTHTHIKLHYEDNFDNSRHKYIQIERPFYSTLSQFSGSFYWEEKSFSDSLQLPNNPYLKSNEDISYQAQDYWVGYEFPLFKGLTYNNRSTNIVMTARYYYRDYYKTPNQLYDPSNYLSDQKLFLGSLGINTQKFAEDSHVFYYDKVEYIPYGKIISITSGFMYKNQENIPYYGTQFSYGNYFKIGYLAGNIEWGSFYKNNKSYQQTLHLRLNYFSPLFQLGTINIRQFLQTNFTLGINRDPFFQDKINLNNNRDIRSFTNELQGTEKLSLTLQTQLYLPKAWYGFHISPYFNFSFGVLGNQETSILNNRIYSKIGIGLMINNDYLVFNRFHLSLAYFPTIPFSGNNIFKFNSFENNDYLISNYQIQQPIVVAFE